MSIIIKYLVRPQRVVLSWLLRDLLHRHKREEAWLRYWCFQTQKPTLQIPEADALSQPHSHQTRALGNAISRWLPRQQIVWGLRKPPCIVARGISWALSVRVFVLELLKGQPAGTILPAGTIYKLAGIIYKLGWTRLQACTATRGPESSKLAGTYDRPDVFTSLRDGNRPHRIVGLTQQGHWDQKHPKVLIVGKKTAKNLIAMYSGPTQFKK